MLFATFCVCSIAETIIHCRIEETFGVLVLFEMFFLNNCANGCSFV
jgi:hypothetical protein